MTDEFPVLDTIDWYGEKLNIFQLLDRLDAAQQVTQGLTAKVELRDRTIAEKNTAIQHLEGVRDRLIDDMRDLARDLARVAGDTHREKNEAILAVIYRLLSAEMGRKHRPYMDDVPF